MAAGVERAGADTIEAATRSADVVAGVGRYQLGQLTRPNVVALPSNLECTLNPSKKKKNRPIFHQFSFTNRCESFTLHRHRRKKAKKEKLDKSLANTKESTN